MTGRKVKNHNVIYIGNIYLSFDWNIFATQNILAKVESLKSNIYIYLGHIAYRILVPLGPLAVKAPSPNHQTTREFP